MQGNHDAIRLLHKLDEFGPSPKRTLCNGSRYREMSEVLDSLVKDKCVLRLAETTPGKRQTTLYGLTRRGKKILTEATVVVAGKRYATDA